MITFLRTMKIEKHSRPRRYSSYPIENQIDNGGYVCTKPSRKCAASMPPQRVDRWLNTKESGKIFQ